MFFILGALLIVLEAVEVQLPNGTFVRQDSQIGVWMLVLGVVLVIVAALFQILDNAGPFARKLRELGDIETKKYSTLRELLSAYVVLVAFAQQNGITAMILALLFET